MTKFSSVIVVLVLAFVIAALAQNSAVIAFNSPLPVQTSLSACTWPSGQPTTGMAICAVNLPTTGPALAISYNGAPFILATGAQGPAGPAGPAGPTGATGPQGPAGTIPTTFTCTSLSTGSGGVTLAGCP